tara:strand:+ start:138 stop:347 length:210 start_codon:yes stop_codon:yes gene_type:complete
MKLTKKQLDTKMEEIVLFAKNRNYDVQNLNEEMFKEIMKDWYLNTLTFNREFKEAPFVVQKNLLKLNNV